MATLLGAEFEHIPDEIEVGPWTIRGTLTPQDEFGYQSGYDDGYEDGEAAGYAEGFDDGLAAATLAPTLSNRTPLENVEPGEPGAFSGTFRVARLTPIEFDMAGVTQGAKVIVTVAYADRNETYVAFDLTEARRWPFDVQADNEVEHTGDETRHIRLLPRGGWPPVEITIDAGCGAKAV